MYPVLLFEDPPAIFVLPLKTILSSVQLGLCVDVKLAIGNSCINIVSSYWLIQLHVILSDSHSNIIFQFPEVGKVYSRSGKPVVGFQII